MIDTHCHLNFPDFEFDLDEVLSTAKMAGVDRFIIPAVSVQSSLSAIRLAEKYPEIYAAIGIHPNTQATQSDWDAIKEHAHHPKVVAIGEIGIDLHHRETSMEYQDTLLRAMLNIAFEINKPIIIHSRNALPQIKMIINLVCSNFGINNPSPRSIGVMHAFEGGVDDAQEFISMGFSIGLGGPITYPNARSKAELAAGLDLDAIVVETDSPYLPPQGLRGKRNEPASIRIICDNIAGRRGIPLEEVSLLTTRNAENVFHLGERS